MTAPLPLIVWSRASTGAELAIRGPLRLRDLCASQLFRKLARTVLIVLPLCGLVATPLAGCEQNWLITGQVNMIRADDYGDLTSRDDAGGEFITEGQPFSIRLQSVFVRMAKEIGAAEFLIYAEIYDVQPDDRQLLVRVLFKEGHQAAGYLLNQRDRLLFGPIIYNGHPIRVRVFVVELDREENEIASQILRRAVQVAATAYPAVGPVGGAAVSIGDLFLALNEDDRELVYDFTLYPSTHSHGPYLRTGHYALIKTENRKRLRGFLLSPGDRNNVTRYQSEDALADVTDEYGSPINVKFEDYTQYFVYDRLPGEPSHPLNEVILRPDDEIFKRVVLRVMGGELWLQTVAFTYQGKVLMAEERFARDSGAAKPIDLPATIGDYTFAKRAYYVGSVPYWELMVARKGKKGLVVEPIQLGERVPYREKTHAVLSIAKGGIPVARSLFEELSAVDRQILEQTLQPSLTAKQVNQRLKALANNLMKIAATRQVVREVTRTTANRAGIVSDTPLPVAYLKRLKPKPKDGADKARNEAIIEIVSAMVQDFPYAADDANNPAALEAMRKWSEQVGHFTPNGDGTFAFKEVTRQ